MPTAPFNQKCNHLGCKNPRSKLNGYCLDHGGKEYIKEIDTIYQTPVWKAIRRTQISKQPLCQACIFLDGRVESAKHIDHVFPWKHYGEQAFTRNVFQSLCHAHHSHKTALERKGQYEHYTQDGVKTYLESDYFGVVGQG
jgi:5-methylcytosine-specific restriction endonuclease McrA